MSRNVGECFVAQKPIIKNTASMIIGRNSHRPGGTEVLYFSKDCPSKQKCQYIEIDGKATFNIILSKPIGVWGADSGANDKGVVITLAFSENECAKDTLCSTDLVRLGLERASSAAEAIDIIGDLITKHFECNDARLGILACDSSEAWLLNAVGKIWAAELKEGELVQVPRELSIGTKIDKSSAKLKKTLKALKLYDGIDELDFAEAFPRIEYKNEYKDEQPYEVSFDLTSMFDILRSREIVLNKVPPQSSHVSALGADGVAVHWFTATPNPQQSVFKPFIFTDNVRVSPLTKIPSDDAERTLLEQLHANRKWETIGTLLRSLEQTCVKEVTKAICESKFSNQEFDELLKDCVEAEVKFYR